MSKKHLKERRYDLRRGRNYSAILFELLVAFEKNIVLSLPKVSESGHLGLELRVIDTLAREVACMADCQYSDKAIGQKR